MKFIDENGQKHDKVCFDGYDIEERTLEGVMIDVWVADDGTITCSFRDKDESYLENYNTKKFLKEARDHVQDIMDEGMFDMFCGPSNGNGSFASIEGMEYDNGTPFVSASAGASSSNGFSVGVKKATDIFK